jgi:metal-dependent amidase/aminoacylase/carboxypeptidase family protein
VICAEIVGAGNVRRDPPLIMASEVHNPAYDFNDAALPYGASFFARPVETRLSK